MSPESPDGIGNIEWLEQSHRVEVLCLAPLAYETSPDEITNKPCRL
jgi:hypothetical protein